MYMGWLDNGGLVVAVAMPGVGWGMSTDATNANGISERIRTDFHCSGSESRERAEPRQQTYYHLLSSHCTGQL